MQKELESDSKFVMRGSETKFTYGKRIAMWHCAEGHSRRKFALRKPCPAFIKVCERHDGTFDVVACFGHLGHPHLSLRAPTACTVRLGAIEGVEKIVAMQDVIEVSEDFLESEESGNYQVVDVNAEVESGSLVE
ncbi:hypothetical protein OESDEN_06982 [Oesophagostomum dentatum]|uniref:Uncharacterized protein n=1 Tax=Oesophagostomum dentatum TaxID=61180 RepID=A0A0B1T7A7_OESDE|nr:hypothetical protein OESDEN_06982 [Oesophagostomum dentatum]